MLNGVIHHLSDDEDPHGVVTKLTSALAPGSYLQLTHFTDFFDDLELVDPGVVFLPEWRPDRPVTYPLEVGAQLLLGGMARMP